MKKTTPVTLTGILLMLMIIPAAIYAQDESYNSQGRFGIRGGVVISKQKLEAGNIDEDPKSKFGADFAILYNFPVGDGFFSLQPELHWMQKGSTLSDFNNGEDVTNTLNYLELPLLLRLNFGGSLKFFAFGGPSIGYLLDVNSDNDVLRKEDFNDTEFGLHVGAGIGFGSFEVDVRYMAGLSDVADSNGNLDEVKNSGFGAGLTFKF